MLQHDVKSASSGREHDKDMLLELKAYAERVRSGLYVHMLQLQCTYQSQHPFGLRIREFCACGYRIMRSLVSAIPL